MRAITLVTVALLALPAVLPVAAAVPPPNPICIVENLDRLPPPIGECMGECRDDPEKCEIREG